jgi:hypothetical protein
MPLPFPPLNASDVIILLAVGAIILLIAAELTSPANGLQNLTINKKRLQKIALTTTVILLLVTMTQIVQRIVSV